MAEPYYTDSHCTLYHGDCREVLSAMPAESVDCVVTSPPYYGLRDYKNTPTIWGGDPSHAHSFDLETVSTEVGRGNWAQATNGRGEAQPGGLQVKREPIRAQQKRGSCACGAWLGFLGLESSPELFVRNMTEVFRSVRRVLRNDGTLWLNIGDSYANGGRKSRDPGQSKIHPAFEDDAFADGLRPDDPPGIKPKDLIGIPWMLAFALRADGWYLRQDIIWHKPNPMPESVTDRCTKAHEYLFLLSKSERYHCDMKAIQEPSSTNDPRRPYTSKGAWAIDGRPEDQQHGGEPRSFHGSRFNTGKTGEHQLGRASAKPRAAGNKSHKLVTEYESSDSEEHRTAAGLMKIADVPWESRNRRSVWTVATAPYAAAHFATFPPELIKPCILAGCRSGGVVLDPFNGSGTTGQVARENGCKYIGIELNEDYCQLTVDRLRQGVLF